jgi:hypothetical protein
MSFALLFNTSFGDSDTGALMGGAHKRSAEAIRHVKRWPARDLFRQEAK